MLLKETMRETGLTRKAIDYYIAQNLIQPSVMDNGYRDFSEEDVSRLYKAAILRRLGLGTEDIKAVLADETETALQTLAVQRTLHIRQEQLKKELLGKLGAGEDYSRIGETLAALEQGETVAERLLTAFPGYYGRFICLHFARFLGEPITTDEQRAAYDDILMFLDTMPPLQFPADLQAYLVENTSHLGIDAINTMLEDTKRSLENPDQFLAENKEMLTQYLAIKQSEEYKRTPLYRLQTLLKEFYGASGYYDIFIPAMKRLSPSYAAYIRQMEAANEKLLAAYPEIAGLS